MDQIKRDERVEVIPYEYCKHQMYAFSELYQYMQENISKIPVLFNRREDCECSIATNINVFEDGEFIRNYYYNGIIFLYSFHNKIAFPVSDVSFCSYNSKDSYTLGAVLGGSDEFDYTADSIGGVYYPIPEVNELTEEMYNQLTFLYPENVVFSSFMIAHVLSLEIDCTIKKNTDIDFEVLLKELKEYLND